MRHAPEPGRQEPPRLAEEDKAREQNRDENSRGVRLHGGEPSHGGRTYAELITGKKANPHGEAPIQGTEERAGEDDNAGRPWKKVTYKKEKKPRTSTAEARQRLSPSSSSHVRHRHPPPRKRTPGGVIEVCGRCRQPGHLMRDCQRVEVCRRCERPGHREAKCTLQPAAIGIIQVHRKQLAGKKEVSQPGREATTVLSRTGERRETPAGPSWRVAPDVEEFHHVSLALDSTIATEEEELMRYSVVTVVKVTEGIVDHRKVMAEVAAVFADEQQWDATPYEDGRVLLQCPSVKTARDLENRGEISFSTFTIRCEPWSTDTEAMGRPEG
ncbi:hypothetical protein J5N97_016746 [Dioscorea zingiberensis]|uniref:CCHC-type domain-containing protein n=1 Tax=Dioscorea zingiberensis TaxID=325984 RepID=A0A9D5CJY0_9LILI|nr:hypothetical protein J5N97_016746 [Dioscorea zingiberensis]